MLTLRAIIIGSILYLVTSGIVSATTGEVTGAVSANTNMCCSENTVILLHGMGRGRASLWVLDTRLQQAGYETLNFSYSAHGYSPEEIAGQLCEFIAENVKTNTYHLIAHSLGNLVIRLAFNKEYPPGLGRIVMLAPPNRPTELARALRDNPIYKWFTSEGGLQFTSEAFYERLPVPDVEFGVIAGNRGQAVLLREPNDGVITVDSTRLEGMQDWVVVPQAHTFIMNSRDVAELCVSFLETGVFSRTNNELLLNESTDDDGNDTEASDNAGEPTHR